MKARDVVDQVANRLEHYFPAGTKTFGDVAREIVDMVAKETRRSHKSHNHYFAAVAEAYQQLPESEEGRFLSSEHMRKWCLIQAGHCVERAFPCDTEQQAILLKAFIQPIDDYAVILHEGSVLKVYTAMSQSEAEMGKKRFQQSKDDVFRILATKLGVPDEVFKANIGRSA